MTTTANDTRWVTLQINDREGTLKSALVKAETLENLEHLRRVFMSSLFIHGKGRWGFHISYTQVPDPDELQQYGPPLTTEDEVKAFVRDFVADQEKQGA